jgi:hypothetical protein
VEVLDQYFASVEQLLRTLGGWQGGRVWLEELKPCFLRWVIQEENDGGGRPKGNFHHVCVAQMDYQSLHETACAPVAAGVVLSASSQTTLHPSIQFSS